MKGQNNASSDSDESDVPSRKCTGNRNASKPERVVEVGWIHEGRVLRKISGGGTRKVTISKSSGKHDLIEEGKRLFFPKGVSKKGDLDQFNTDILDYKETALPDGITIGEMYELVKMGVLRFYFATKRKPETSDSDDNIPAITKRKRGEPKLANIEPVAPNSTTPPALPHADVVEQKSSVLTDMTNVEILAQNDSILANYEIVIHDDSVLPDLSNVEVATQNSCMLPQSAGSNVQDEPFEEDVIPGTSGVPDHYPAVIQVHRVNIVQDMVAHFKAIDIIQTQLIFRFIDEVGEDAQGVSREAYTTFWVEFCDRWAEGEKYLVPALNPDWQVEEWQAVGRILLKGYLDHGVFPIQLAPAFVVALILGEEHIQSDVLMDSFMHFISNKEREAVEEALKGNVSEEIQDDLVDLFSRFECHSIPSKETLCSTVLQIAHKELVQESKYALDCMAQVSRDMFCAYFQGTDAILEMYQAKKPTAKRILQLLQCTPSNKAEDQSFRYLQQYIKSLDDAGLKKMLRFLTAAEIVCVPNITVQFTKLDGLGRRPIAHTCGPVLEMPSTYSAYREFRSDMQNILSADSSWKFDIV